MVGEYVLNNHKIDPHKDIDLIQNIDFANIANAFASGTGEYVQLFEPQASLFEKKASAISWLRSRRIRPGSLHDFYGKTKLSEKTWRHSRQIYKSYL